MTAKITKIHPLKIGRTGVASYIRVEFLTESGGWAKTDLVPTFRNYPRWKPLLDIGNTLSGLRMKAKFEIDADSIPHLVQQQTLL
jgi:hypothetical protein